MKYLETYNASEGFFGIQDDPNDTSLLLMLDYGVYYEFIPTSELGKSQPQALLLEEIEKTSTTHWLLRQTEDSGDT